MYVTINQIRQSSEYQELVKDGYEIYLSEFPHKTNSPILMAMKKGNHQTGTVSYSGDFPLSFYIAKLELLKKLVDKKRKFYS